MSWNEEPTSAAAPPEGAVPANGSTWFVVGPAKFVFMSVVTFHLYHLYWFYRQWDHVRVATGANIKPAARSLFAPIFCDALFQRILESAEPERRHRLKALWLAIAYIVSILMCRLPSDRRLHASDYRDRLQEGPIAPERRRNPALPVHGHEWSRDPAHRRHATELPQLAMRISRADATVPPTR
jgi:hypothetical protein